MNHIYKDDIVEHAISFISTNPIGVLEILGPTASGKTDFTVELAKYIENKTGKKSEVIIVDSRQIYRECDISSAKMTKSEMQNIPHWGLDLKNPDEHFSAFEFQQYAFDKIEEIQQRGNIPILSGGTMFWLDAVSENYVFSPEPVDENQDGNKERSRINLDEKQFDKSKKKGLSKYKFFKIGLHWDRQKLYNRINQRAKIQFQSGLIEETQQIMTKYDLSPNVLTSFGYLEIIKYLNGKVTLDRAIQLNQQRNRNYAKRQLTWWRGREDVNWVDMED